MADALPPESPGFPLSGTKISETLNADPAFRGWA